MFLTHWLLRQSDWSSSLLTHFNTTLYRFKLVFQFSLVLKCMSHFKHNTIPFWRKTKEAQTLLTKGKRDLDHTHTSLLYFLNSRAVSVLTWRHRSHSEPVPSSLMMCWADRCAKGSVTKWTGRSEIHDESEQRRLWPLWISSILWLLIVSHLDEEDTD